MYAIKVGIGSEWLSLRRYSSSFAPAYTSAAEDSVGKKLYVVPGYIFSRKLSGNAVWVPDSDWKVIDAIADTHHSTLDVKTGKIIDGPLKGLLILRINPTLKSVCIRAKILGETRDYWLAVSFSNTNITQKERTNKKSTKEKKDMAKYSEEQLQKALERAAEIGIHKAAAENEVSWQSLQAYARKQGKLDEVSLKKKKAAKPTTAENTTTTEEKAPATRGRKKIAEKAKTKMPKKVKQEAASAAPTTPATPTEESKPEASALEIENAVLKAENEALKAQVEKYRKALNDLIG